MTRLLPMLWLWITLTLPAEMLPVTENDGVLMLLATVSTPVPSSVITGVMPPYHAKLYVLLFCGTPVHSTALSMPIAKSVCDPSI